MQSTTNFLHRSGLLIGSFTGERGSGSGLSHWSRDGVPLTAPLDIPSPSFVAAHPLLPIAYTTGATDSAIRTLSLAHGHLSEVHREATGVGPCHVAIDSAARLLAVASYGDGSVGLFRLASDGRIASRIPTVALPPANARPSRAHHALFVGDDLMLTTDLGRDLVRVWRVSGHSATEEYAVRLDPGSGPRFLVEHPDGTVFVLTEYSVEVVTLRRTGAFGRYEVVDAVAASRNGPRSNDAGAALTVTRDGSTLHAGVRGSNVIATLSYTAGRLTPVGEGATASGPRHHLQHGTRIVVAAERDDAVVSMHLDAHGVVDRELWRSVTGSPTCVVATI